MVITSHKQHMIGYHYSKLSSENPSRDRPLFCTSPFFIPSRVRMTGNSRTCTPQTQYNARPCLWTATMQSTHARTETEVGGSGEGKEWRRKGVGNYSPGRESRKLKSPNTNTPTVELEIFWALGTWSSH